MVCSNSFRSDDAEHNAVGLLHQEMRTLDSLIMRAGDEHRVPAGSALAVDRHGFAEAVTQSIERHPNITIVRERVDALPDIPRSSPPGRSPGQSSRRRSCRNWARRPGLLRRHRAHRPPRSVDMDIAWIASRWKRAGQGLHQLPARQGPVRGLRRRRWSTARKCRSRNGKRTRPISRGACRSR